MTKLLLVDDEMEFVSALAERLSLRGYEADWAVTAEDALAKVESGDYQLCLLDMKMPRYSGVELKRKIEELSPGMRFVFLTGHGSEACFEEAESESEFCLLKPVRVEKVMQTIQDALGSETGGDK